jgi:Glyoxalase/Bleomycin resistance protein/Dioxygenase superfamily
MAACLSLWQGKLGLDLRLTLGRDGGRQLQFLRMGDSILELAGESDPEHPGERDVIWGVAYRVGDIATAVDRLRAEGVTVSDPRPGNAPDTTVADLKPGFSHDVRTLLIQQRTPRGKSG